MRIVWISSDVSFYGSSIQSLAYASSQQSNVHFVWNSGVQFRKNIWGESQTLWRFVSTYAWYGATKSRQNTATNERTEWKNSPSDSMEKRRKRECQFDQNVLKHENQTEAKRNGFACILRCLCMLVNGWCNNEQLNDSRWSYWHTIMQRASERGRKQNAPFSFILRIQYPCVRTHFSFLLFGSNLFLSLSRSLAHLLLHFLIASLNLLHCTLFLENLQWPNKPWQHCKWSIIIGMVDQSIQ